jgi:hypothetical protein
MPKNNNRKKQAKLLRIFRKIHRTLGASLFVFFIFISVTGVLLGWKKNTGGHHSGKITYRYIDRFKKLASYR